MDIAESVLTGAYIAKSSYIPSTQHTCHRTPFINIGKYKGAKAGAV